MATLRQELLSDVEGDVLELGAGTGLNLEFYGAGVRKVVLVEPDVLLHGPLRRRLAQSRLPGVISESAAEALPFPNDSFDVVVSTLVLCTVSDPWAVLAEIARVLRPGGRFLFIEHVIGAEGSRTAAWQLRLHDAWHSFACGCHADRDTRGALDASPLDIVEIAEGKWRGMPPIVQPLIVGSAVAGG